MPAKSNPDQNTLAIESPESQRVDSQAVESWLGLGKQIDRKHAAAADANLPEPACCRILIIDPDPASRRLITSALAELNHELIETSLTSEAIQVIEEAPVDLVMIEANAPEMGGIEFCQMLRRNPSTSLLPIFILATAGDRDLEMRVFSAGADECFIAPLKQSALRTRVDATLRLKSLMQSLDSSETVLFKLARSVEDRDPDLGQHCQRLALMASAMGLALGLPPADIRSLQYGGYLHDIGKVGIPDRVLFKAGPLTDDEWEIMRSHSVRGERICACMKSLAPVLPIIRHHHEKYDGTGYPDGLKGTQIPQMARILQVVDIYDALTTERPYKRAYTPEEALSIMREETKKGWRDPELVEVFAELLPMFRHASIGDTSHLSLQALADQLDRYRKTAVRQHAEKSANSNA
jgi:putative two-component system response regulator